MLRYRLRGRTVRALVGVMLMGLTLCVGAFAHGGEDHAEDKAPIVSVGAGTVTRVGRVGDFEVTIKHAPVEPDREVSARLFVTRYESNEPVDGARVSVVIGDGGRLPEVTAQVSTTAGIYEARLPPLPKGRYDIGARLDVGGTSGTARFAPLEVAPALPTAVESGSTRARTALIALAALSALGAAGAVVYRLVQNARRNRVKGEPIAA